MAERYHVIISRRASQDLERIVGYIRKDSPQNAVGVAQMLLDAIDSLNEFPHRYEVHQHRRKPGQTVRSMAVPPFIVYYRVMDATRTVLVHTLRHGAQRQPRRFG